MPERSDRLREHLLQLHSSLQQWQMLQQGADELRRDLLRWAMLQWHVLRQRLWLLWRQVLRRRAGLLQQRLLQPRSKLLREDLLLGPLLLRQVLHSEPDVLRRQVQGQDFV